MKRSEMLEILDKAINNNLYQDYQFSPEDIECILATLEKAGMKPPINEKTKDGHLHGLDWEYYYWELEND